MTADKSTQASVDAAMTNAGYPKTSGDLEREGGGRDPDDTREPHLARGPDQPSAPQKQDTGDEPAEVEESAAGGGYEDRTVEELRDELRGRELPTSGTKAELVERLQDDDAAT